MPDDIAYKIVEDDSHNLWFGTNNGLVRFNPHMEEVRVYTERDGLPTNRFNYKSGLKSQSGKIYIGTMEGLVAFEPQKFKKNMFIPPVYITQLSIFDKIVSPNSTDIHIAKSIQYTDKIQLAYNQSNINISFAALSYTSPISNNYAYKMEGVDNDWVYTKNSYTASYVNLQPGKYVFKVKGTNNDEMWNLEESILSIEILPPWWKSPLAYLTYFALFTLLVYGIIKFWLQKYREKDMEKRRLYEIGKEKELYEAKINFFTEIAHEIRTPVTLINGPLESIMSHEVPDPRMNYNLNIIQKNTKQLLSLINQLLDFRKVESDKFAINLNRVDIVELIDSVISRFEEAILKKKLSWTVDKGGYDHFLANVDKEAMNKILNNLLSNAVKYTSNAIALRLIINANHFIIKIANNGELISQEYKDKIFDPFFRIKEANSDVIGSGLGLSLARSLAEAHKGNLRYTDEDDINNFYVEIPLDRNAVQSAFSYNDKTHTNEDDTKGIKESEVGIIDNIVDKADYKKTMLIVEDNQDILDFLTNELEMYYKIENAGNGAEAIKMFEKHHFDIVLSDVMMPQRNGFELCQYIKNDPLLNNTIVILLTAKDDLDSQIHGLEIGADAYVKKPFSIKYITTLISTLDRNKQKTKDNYVDKPFLQMKQPGLNKSDTLFLEKIVEVINENISDSSFNVERLADIMNLSRSSLHRRMKSTIDSTPTDFIRLIRLQKSILLIQDGIYRANEICYLIGINSPSYFIKLFYNQYGMTPKEYEDSLKTSKSS